MVLLFLLFSLVSSQSCSSRSPCPNEGLCDPTNNTCASWNNTYQCGSWGAFLNCGPAGVVMGECGSGTNPDCTDSSATFCPDMKVYEAIDCNYPALVPTGGYKTLNWYCGKYGEDLSCSNYGGSVLVGVCGSGGHEDCSQYCTGYHAILCASGSYYTMDWSKCVWKSGGYGEYVYCDPGYVAAGHCGSGKTDDCGRNIWHKLQCCPFVYS